MDVPILYLLHISALFPAASSLKCLALNPEAGEVVETVSWPLPDMQPDENLPQPVPCITCSYWTLGGGYIQGSQACHYDVADPCKEAAYDRDNVTGIMVKRHCCSSNKCNAVEEVQKRALRCYSDMSSAPHITYQEVSATDPTKFTRKFLGLDSNRLTVFYPCSQCVYGKREGRMVGGTRTCWADKLARGEECNKIPVPGASAQEAHLNVQLHDGDVVCCNKADCNSNAARLSLTTLLTISPFIPFFFPYNPSV